MLQVVNRLLQICDFNKFPRADNSANAGGGAGVLNTCAASSVIEHCRYTAKRT